MLPWLLFRAFLGLVVRIEEVELMALILFRSERSGLGAVRIEVVYLNGLGTLIQDGLLDLVIDLLIDLCKDLLIDLCKLLFFFLDRFLVDLFLFLLLDNRLVETEISGFLTGPSVRFPGLISSTSPPGRLAGLIASTISSKWMRPSPVWSSLRMIASITGAPNSWPFWLRNPLIAYRSTLVV